MFSLHPQLRRLYVAGIEAEADKENALSIRGLTACVLQFQAQANRQLTDDIDAPLPCDLPSLNRHLGRPSAMV